MLKVCNLSKKYNKVFAVKDVSFTLDQGVVGVLLGPNGAGKSTVIKSISGLIKKNGEIYIDGKVNTGIDAKKVFAYVPEMPAMFPALTVKEHLEYIAHAYNLKDYEEHMNSLLERFELSDKCDKLGDELSKGMMQKVSICCALLIKPKMLLLDEPMVGLDPKAIKELKVVISELKNSGTTILLSTHMLEMVKDIWDIVIIMDKGNVIKITDRNQTSDKDIEEIFFDITEGGTDE